MESIVYKAIKALKVVKKCMFVEYAWRSIKILIYPKKPLSNLADAREVFNLYTKHVCLSG